MAALAEMNGNKDGTIEITGFLRLCLHTLQLIEKAIQSTGAGSKLPT